MRAKSNLIKKNNVTVKSVDKKRWSYKVIYESEISPHKLIPKGNRKKHHC